MVNVDFCVSTLCCCAYTPGAHIRPATIRNTICLIAHLKRNLHKHPTHTSAKNKGAAQRSSQPAHPHCYSTISLPFILSCPNPQNFAHLKSYVPGPCATKSSTWSTPFATFPLSSGWSNTNPGVPLSLAPSG